MKQYPSTLSEDETLARVVAGASLARYGDGEFKLCRGASIKSQPADPELRRRLLQILQRPGNCLVGIPNILSATPKADFWRPYMGSARGLLAEGQQYASAFVSRPDSAPWIDRPDYWARVESLWRGQAVTLVRGSTKSLTAEMLEGAGEITEIVAPRYDAWRSYGDLLERIGRPTRALLCLGPTASVLAFDLAVLGVHAIDLGHVGMFLRKVRAGVPVTVTEEDKRA